MSRSRCPQSQRTNYWIAISHLPTSLFRREIREATGSHDAGLTRLLGSKIKSGCLLGLPLLLYSLESDMRNLQLKSSRHRLWPRPSDGSAVPRLDVSTQATIFVWDFCSMASLTPASAHKIKSALLMVNRSVRSDDCARDLLLTYLPRISWYLAIPNSRVTVRGNSRQATPLDSTSKSTSRPSPDN